MYMFTRDRVIVWVKLINASHRMSFEFFSYVYESKSKPIQTHIHTYIYTYVYVHTNVLMLVLCICQYWSNIIKSDCVPYRMLF